MNPSDRPNPEAKGSARQAPSTASEGSAQSSPDTPGDAKPSDAALGRDKPGGNTPPAPGRSTGKAQEASIGQPRGSGSRSVDPPASAPPREEPQSADTPKRRAAEARTTGSNPPNKGARKAHQKGRPPRKPSPTLPAGAPRVEPDPVARRSIAGGATQDEERAFPSDPQLRALRDAERALFPRPLDGVEPGWSWDLESLDPEGPSLLATGVPSGPRLEAASPSGADRAAPGPSNAEWLRSLALPDLPVRFDARLVRYLEFYRDTPSGRSIIRAWAKKSGKYSTALRMELARAGLPRDLVWLSLVESSHNPDIQSPAGAAGLWQLVQDTARIYGLTVDRWVDERLDPERSTAAAVRYLDDLRRRFGSWELAMAAYNMGHAGLARAVRKYNTNDYWELSRHEAGVPWETALYVPKILAVALVMNNRAAFGLSDVKADGPIQFDTVRVGSGVSLSRVAAAAQVGLAEITELNPQWVASRTPPVAANQKAKTVAVRVPQGKGIETSQRLNQEIAKDPPLEPILIRHGSTLASLASSRNTTEARLRELNNIGNSESLMPGTVLLVPRGTASTVAAPTSQDPAAGRETVIVPSTQFTFEDKRRVFYRTLPGDTLESVAAAFQVSREDLVATNALDPESTLLSSMVLQVFVPTATKLDRIYHREESEVRILTIGTPEFIDYYEGQQGRKRKVVTAQAGDTLRTLGQRYGVSVGSMERINRRSNRDPLNPGDTVVVYVPVSNVDRAVSQEEAIPADPLEPASASLLPVEADP